jgi:hypothetical protein
VARPLEGVAGREGLVDTQARHLDPSADLVVGIGNQPCPVAPRQELGICLYIRDQVEHLLSRMGYQGGFLNDWHRAEYSCMRLGSKPLRKPSGAPHPDGA